ncbi:hypothetical protein D3C86_1577630 [compost metagenome]
MIQVSRPSTSSAEVEKWGVIPDSPRIEISLGGDVPARPKRTSGGYFAARPSTQSEFDAYQRPLFGSWTRAFKFSGFRSAWASIMAAAA